MASRRTPRLRSIDVTDCEGPGPPDIWRRTRSVARRRLVRRDAAGELKRRACDVAVDDHGRHAPSAETAIGGVGGIGADGVGGRLALDTVSDFRRRCWRTRRRGRCRHRTRRQSGRVGPRRCSVGRAYAVPGTNASCQQRFGRRQGRIPDVRKPPAETTVVCTHARTPVRVGADGLIPAGGTAPFGIEAVPAREPGIQNPAVRQARASLGFRPGHARPLPGRMDFGPGIRLLTDKVLTPRSACWRTGPSYAQSVEMINPPIAPTLTTGRHPDDPGSPCRMIHTEKIESPRS